MKLSISTVDGRMSRIKQKVTVERLEVLMKKRIRQLRMEILRAPTFRVRRRLEAKLQCLE